MNKEVFIYRIDSADTIISISDNWQIFAEENAWDGFLRPEDVVGQKIWKFIQGIETQYLYQELFKRVREGISPQAIPFRCDSPSERRYLELFIKSLPDGQIEIISTILRSESRSTVKLLAVDTARSTDFITVCSMCKMIKVSAEKWIEIEDGLIFFKLFETDEMPQLTHGLCQPCCQAAQNSTPPRPDVD